MTKLGVHLVPEDNATLAKAVREAGGDLVPLDQADALVWAGGGPDRFPRSLPASVRWVQLPSAGIEGWFAAGVIDRERTWTSAAGAYADTVAEHAVALLLAGVRGLYAAVPQRSWQRSVIAPDMGTLVGSTVTILGAGGIGRATIPPLTALGAEVLAVNRSGRPVPGAAQTYAADDSERVWERTDHVIVAAPATAETRHLVGERELAQLGEHSWVVNIARGSLIDTDALVAALNRLAIGGAALDVTDPEPLPDGHPLWGMPHAIITPHVANPDRVMGQALARHVGANVARRIEGRDLLGLVDVDAGY